MKRQTVRFHPILLLWASILMLICSYAHGQEIGIDPLGIRRGAPAWDCNAMMRAVNTLPGQRPLGAFEDTTFGNDDSCLDRALDSGKFDIYRGHLKWTNHAPISANQLIPYARQLSARCARHPGVTCFASLVCEHSMTAQQSAAMNAALKPYLNGIPIIVDSGMKGADPAALRECHGPTARCTGISLDGQSVTDVDWEDTKRHGSKYVLLWDRSFNCRYADGDNRPPNKRTDCPNADQWMHFARLLYPMPPWPPGLPKLGPNEIWKPSAENYGGCAGRACKPVLILNIRVPAVRVLAMNGQLIATMPFGGSFGKNQSRYYLAMTSFQLGQSGESLARSEFVILDTGRGRYVVNAYRRFGLFRNGKMKALYKRIERSEQRAMRTARHESNATIH